MLFSGIDLHKRSVAIHTLDAAGTVVRAANLPARLGALTASFGMLPRPGASVGLRSCCTSQTQTATSALPKHRSPIAPEALSWLTEARFS